MLQEKYLYSESLFLKKKFKIKETEKNVINLIL